MTNTGPTVVTGDVGVDPGTSITGFTGPPSGSNTGAVNQTNSAAAQAQADLLTAYNNAAGLSPTTSGLSQLNGKSLSPGVYSGGALTLSNNGSLTLAGNSTAVWVFQAASSLTIGSATHILFTGGANACNVFWKVGSSASIGTSAHFAGTILAKQSITAATTASIEGRLLAGIGAVTLQSNNITVPNGCAVGSAPTTTDGTDVTSGSPTDARVGTPYSFTIHSTGTPTPTYTVGSGGLPAGLTLNGTTGVISGTPTRAGISHFSIIASNGSGTDVTANLSITTAPPVLATTGTDSIVPLALGLSLVAVGLGLGAAKLTRRRLAS